MNILVTGGSGFIGTNLVADLLKRGNNVTIYDKEKSKAYPELCIVGDIRDKEKLSRSSIGVDAVYHLAAEHRDNISPISLYYEVNVGGAENLVFALEKNGIKRLIFTSTVALYGLNPENPSESSTVKPFNDYGQSKYKSEIIFENWVKNNNSRSLGIVRPTVIFGEKNRGNVYNLLHQLSTGKFVMVGKGTNRKSMGYVLNLSSFLVTLLQLSSGKFLFNYADKPDLSMNELIQIFNDTFGKNNENNLKVPYTLGLLIGYCYDVLAKVTGRTYPISSIRLKKFCANTVVNTNELKKTGFVPAYSLTEGLSRMIKSEFLQGGI